MFRLPFELLLALRYLRPKRTFVSIITLISVLGVTLGVAVLIIVISVMSGFDKQMRDRILGFNAHMKVARADGSMPDYSMVMAIVRTNQAVTGVAPVVRGQVLLKTQPDHGQSLWSSPILRGVDPKAEITVSMLLTNVVDGHFDLSGHSLLLGIDYAHNMRLSVGDHVAIYSPHELKQMDESRGHTNESAILPADYEVSGIFDVGYYEYNASVAIASLDNAQDLYDLRDPVDTVHELMVLLDDPYKAPQVRKALSAALGSNYVITTWMEENSALLNAIMVEKNVMFYLLIFIVIVAALCILSALITFVVQKTREIGMLKALGATRLQVSFLFLGQSAIIGVMGVVLGYGLGMLALAYRNEFLRFMNSVVGIDLLPASVYGFGDLPALIIGKDIVLICVSSFIICILGGVIPAWQAGRLKPVEALRYE
jgi:lipoprotein-releasing system permease protein